MGILQGVRVTRNERMAASSWRYHKTTKATGGWPMVLRFGGLPDHR
jgi:hypothetical protein